MWRNCDVKCRLLATGVEDHYCKLWLVGVCLDTPHCLEDQVPLVVGKRSPSATGQSHLHGQTVLGSGKLTVIFTATLCSVVGSCYDTCTALTATCNKDGQHQPELTNS
ncbi:hypothetical protein BaRGS_00020774 [Batillaria attramentaria]|uniref:Uncharacterized protein n=1 Tax=Batillaria attramentaria TaxID=370345 RepID=A0ABD0KLP9_9CAEN